MKLKKILAMAAIAVFGGVNSVSAEEVTWPLPNPSTNLTDIGINTSSAGETLDPVGGWYYMLNGNGTYATLNNEHKLASSTTNAEPIFLNTATGWAPEVWLVSTEGYVYMPGADTWSTLANGADNADNRFWKYTVSNGKYKLNNQAKHRSDNKFLAPNGTGAGQIIYADKTANTEWALVPAYKASLIARMNKYYSAYIEGKSTPEATALKTQLEEVYNEIKDIKITNDNYNTYFNQIQKAVAKVNANELLVNPGFETCSIGGWTNDGAVKMGELSTDPANNPKSGRWFVEKYGSSGSIDFNQITPEVSAGAYKVGVNARNETGEPVYVYGNSGQTEIGATTTRYYANVYLKNDGTIKLGVKGENNPANRWFAIDDFTLEYLGNPINLAATALPAEAVTADDWYKYDINVAGNYKVTSTGAATIKYTQNGEQEVDAAGTTDVVFTVGESKTIEGLAVGTLYVKANAATTITIEADSKSYTVGSATANMTSIQGNRVVTVSYNDATTNDDKASFAINGTPAITFAGNAITVNTTANGFTFTVPADVTVGQTYTLSIPANAFGYAAGNTYNEAQNIEFTTPYVFDGIYYVKSADGRYISRGNNYNTRAIADNYGVAMKVVTNADNITTFQFIDNNLYLFDAENQTVYTDNATKPKNWLVIPTYGGYNIINMNDNGSLYDYLTIASTPDTGYKYCNIVCSSTSYTVFTFEATTDHPAEMAAKKDAQAAAVAADFGLDAITTKAGLDALAAILPASEVTDGVDAKAAGAELYQNQGDISQTLTDLPNGLYKVSVKAFQRVTFNSNDIVDGKYYGPTTTLYANDQEVQLCSVYEQTTPSTTAWSGGSPADWQYAGNYYPNNIESSKAAMEAGNYTNEIYVNVTDGTLKFGIFKGNKCGNGDWLYYKDFAVTYYGETTHPNIEVELAVGEAQYSTFIAPFDAELPTGVKAYTVDGTSDNELVMTEQSSIQANTPVVLFSETPANETLTGVSQAEAATYTVGLLTGVYAPVEITDGYVLQMVDEEVKFCKVSAEDPITVPANKAYLSVLSSAKAFSLNLGDDNTTAISAVNALIEGKAEIYTVGGVKLEKLQKGINIVNGVPVMVK